MYKQKGGGRLLRAAEKSMNTMKSMKHFAHWTTKHLNKYGGYIKTYSAGAIVQLLREEDVFRSAP